MYGDYDPDVAYGVGRLIARDRPLRTLVALTCATGRSAEVFGPSYKDGTEYWLKLDRQVRAYGVPARAQALWTQYCQSTQTEDIEIRELIVAYVQGILDEINAHGATALTTMYRSLIDRHSTHPDWPYGPVLLDLDDPKLTRLFQRATDANNFLIQQWEPFAAILFWLGRVGVSLGKPEPPPMDGADYDLFTDFFHFGSNSWGITDEANAESGGHTFLQADSHNGFARAHLVRFRSRYGKLDAGGAAWEGLGPFLFNGAFTKNAAWATMFHTCDDRDILKFPARKSGSDYQYQDYYQSESGPWVTMTPTPLTLWYYDFGNTTLTSTTKTVYYLQTSTAAPSTAVQLWAAWPDNDDWSQTAPSEIKVDRLGTLEPELSTGAQIDMPRTLYKMLTASTAKDIADVLVNEPLGIPLNYMIGSGKVGTIDQQLIYLPAGRVPYRKNEYVYDPPNPDWSRDYFGDILFYIDLEEDPERRWIDVGGRLFHDPGHFPRANAHIVTPEFGKIKYMANCNASPHWIFGRGTPFPVPHPGEIVSGFLEPRYEFKIGTSPVYQKNPIVADLSAYGDYLTKPPPDGFSPSITLSYLIPAAPYMDLTFGGLPMRQEWAINRLQNLYEGTQPCYITEPEIRSLINDRIDSTAYYLQRIEYEASPTSLNWFQASHAYLGTLSTLVLPRKTEVPNLMNEFEGWASSSGEDANLLVSSPSTYVQTPIKWVIFWHQFREKGSLTTLDRSIDDWLYRAPYLRYYWPDVRDENGLPEGAIAEVREALKDAAVYTVENTTGLASTLRLEHVLRIRTPFVDGAEYGVTASVRSLKITGFKRWLVEPAPSTAPEMEVRLQSYLPILVRFTASGSLSERKISLMSYNVVSDNLGLPEWSNATLLQRYKNSIKRSAEGTLTDLMLEESQLQAMNAYAITVYYNPPWNRPIKR